MYIEIWIIIWICTRNKKKSFPNKHLLYFGSKTLNFKILVSTLLSFLVSLNVLSWFWIYHSSTQFEGMLKIVTDTFIHYNIIRITILITQIIFNMVLSFHTEQLISCESTIYGWHITNATGVQTFFSYKICSCMKRRKMFFKLKGYYEARSIA